jgi:hypothetical protein
MKPEPFAVFSIFTATNQHIMKKNSFLHLFILLSIPLLFAQCTSQRMVTINTLRPAQITFPSDVNSLLLVDRTKFEHRGTEILAGVLSGQIPGSDRAALQSAMTSLQQTLLLSPRFKIQMATEVLWGNSLTASFPDPLNWNEIQRLCQEYSADAVVSFEIFNSDFIPTEGKRRVKKTITDDNGVQKEIETDEYYVDGVGSIKMGIRIYDPKSMTIVDQQLFSKTNTWHATADSKAGALAALINRSEATRYVASQAASDYAYKIAPMPVRITRNFYSKSKKTPQIEQGSRLADVNDWKGAESTWENAITNYTPAKEAGMLCYDVAIAYEVLGDLETAKKWASRSYVQYGNKQGRYYFNMLDRRLADEATVGQQMK